MLSDGYCKLCDKKVVIRGRDGQLKCALCGNTNTVVGGEKERLSETAPGEQPKSRPGSKKAPTMTSPVTDDRPKKISKGLVVGVVIVILLFFFLMDGAGPRRFHMGGGWGVFILLFIVLRLLTSRNLKR